MDIKGIKSRLSILQVLAHYKIQVDKHNQIKCPFHPDDKPSCKIYPETGTFHCFGCNKTGDVIDFIMYIEGCTKHEAIKKAIEFIGENTGTPLQSVSGKGEVCRGGVPGPITAAFLKCCRKAPGAALTLWNT